MATQLSNKKLHPQIAHFIRFISKIEFQKELYDEKKVRCVSICSIFTQNS
jgi:hypothetical protein